MSEALDAFFSALFKGFLSYRFITHKCRTDEQPTKLGFINYVLQQIAEQDRFFQNLTLQIFCYFTNAILRCYQKMNCHNSSYSRQQAQHNGDFD
jgi:hypothetical protein